jgi:hypothetical protein
MIQARRRVFARLRVNWLLVTAFLGGVWAGPAGAAPFINSSEGVGKYGYLETNATTHIRLHDGGFGNIDGIGARFWTGKEYIYWDWDPGCGGADETTGNYSPANHIGGGGSWNIGDIVYISAVTWYCSSGSRDGNNYNEISKRLIEVASTTANLSHKIYPGAPSGTNNLVLSFTIKPGASGITLKRLWVQNAGTATENGSLSNAVQVFHETVTGSEKFDGSESSFFIYGDYGGNSGSNNEYGMTA